MKTLFVNKYQPVYFKDFGENNETIRIIQTLLFMDNLNILLVGDMTSGKTSILNAIIREYYHEYDEKEYQENVLFINNLKEQGIQYYRTEVKTFCQTSTHIKGKKKIIILDDIDLINEQSQQVFRNCIDKYSNNVAFLASCSNKQKVIETLQSRLINIKINPLKQTTLEELFNKIAEKEGILIEEDAKQFVLNVSNNMMKVLIHYMEKFKLYHQPITLEVAMSLCTDIHFSVLEMYTEQILQNDLQNAIRTIYTVYEKGYSVMDILDNYFAFVKNTDLLNETQKYQIIPYLCKYISIFHNLHEDEIELALFTNNLIKEFHNPNKLCSL
jgi:DNA polymerase III delta prime subunit